MAISYNHSISISSIDLNLSNDILCAELQWFLCHRFYFQTELVCIVGRSESWQWRKALLPIWMRVHWSRPLTSKRIHTSDQRSTAGTAEKGKAPLRHPLRSCQCFEFSNTVEIGRLRNSGKLDWKGWFWQFIRHAGLIFPLLHSIGCDIYFYLVKFRQQKNNNVEKTLYESKQCCDIADCRQH